MTPREELLQLDAVAKRFLSRPSLVRRRRTTVHAVDGVSLSLRAGETIAVVGESGSGKSTLLRLILGLLPVDEGRVLFRGEDVTRASGSDQRRLCRHVQMVFQDAFAALSPRMTVAKIIAEPMVVHGIGDRPSRRAKAQELLELVGLRARDLDRFPHEFSGGQRQRISIARALALEPEVLLLDEPVAALDVSTQAQIINLLQRLQRELGLAYVLVSHDLSVVDHVADQVAVMYLGRVVEHGTRDEVFGLTRHPYTKALLSAVPVVDPREREAARRIVLEGELPDPGNPPSGCVFRTRCWKAAERCAAERPALVAGDDEAHPVACHFPEPAAVAAGAPHPIAERSTRPA